MEPNLKTLVRTVAEVQLVYKTTVAPSKRPCIATSKDAYDILLQCWDEDCIEFVEEFKILLLNRGNKVLGLYELSKGGIAGTVADSRLIFIAALKANACAMILSHNHPSGSLRPSRSDEEMTNKIKEAGKLLDIQVLDHIILSKEDYYSFADEGLL